MIRSRRRTGERGRRFRRRIDERGEALPAAILFVGVIFTVLIGVHVVLIALARTAVQTAAEAAVVAAQSAGPGDSSQDCDGDTTDTDTVRECAGIMRARLAMAASGSSITEIQPATIDVEVERGVVTARVHGGTISPVLGGLKIEAQSCGPLEDVPALELTGMDVWEC